MSFLSRLGFVRDVAVQAEQFSITPADVETLFPGVSFSTANAFSVAPRVSRVDALSVPAVKRARDLICGTLGGLPLAVYDTERVSQVSNLLDQPEVPRTRSVTMTRTYEDLLFEGLALWRVSKRAWTKYPEKVERISRDRYTIQEDDSIWVDGKHVPDRDLILFESPNEALLIAGARAIRTCLLLEQTSNLYANNPYPLAYFTPKENVASPEQEVISETLGAWDDARKQYSTAWVPEWAEYNTVEPMSPANMQLVEARQHAVLEIARIAGVDADYLSVAVSSDTYANTENRRQDLIDFSLSTYMHAVEGRLSMADVTQRGYYVKTKLDGFLRGDTKTRMDVYKIGKEVGAYTHNEIRELEDRPDTPEPKAITAAPAIAPKEAIK